MTVQSQNMASLPWRSSLEGFSYGESYLLTSIFDLSLDRIPVPHLFHCNLDSSTV
jgi:hypothetical protein